MSNHEFDDPELIEAIKVFLRQGKKVDSEEEPFSLSMVRKDLRDSVVRMQEQGQGLADFLHQLQGVPMEAINAEQAVVNSGELTDLARNTVQLVITSGISGSDREGVYVSWSPNSPFKAFKVGLSGNAVPGFLSTEVILFENYLSGNIREDKPQLAKALGIDGERPIGMLTVGSYIGAVTDPQTRSVMEHIAKVFLEAPGIRHFSYTNYYFFGNRMGKVVHLPSSLLGGRVIVDEIDHFPSRTLSEVTAGDLVIAKIGLLAVQDGLISQLA